MMTNPELLNRFEAEWARKDPVDPLRNLHIYEALYREAVALGVLPGADPMEGIEHKIEWVRSLNVRRTAQADRGGV